MIKTAKSQGFVTYEQLNKVTSSENLSSEQIEDVMSMLSEMGINVIENEEEEQASEATPIKKSTTEELIELMIQVECICVRWVL